MIDRTPTKVIESGEGMGAVRYGEYDETTGALIAHHYFKPDDEPVSEGTPLNKANLLTDEAAALFGYMNGAVPNDVFKWFGPLHLHYWRIRGVSSYYVPLVGSSGASYRNLVTGNSWDDNTSAGVQYGDEVYADANGAIHIKNPKHYYVYMDGRNIDEVNDALLGKFFRCTGYYGGSYNGPSLDENIYKLGNYCNFNWTGSVFRQGSTSYPVSSVLQSGLGQWTYEASENRNAYPDSGIIGGKEYEYVGVPFENIKTYIPKFTTLNYLGSGSYGSGNPNSFTVDFPIKCAMIYPANSATGILYVYGQTAHTITFALSSDMKTLSWYGSSAAAQCNTKNTTYVVAVWG